MRWIFLFFTNFYQTIWFHIIAFLFFLFGLFGIIKWRSWTLQKENHQLEEILERRTKEINNKNFALKKQTLILNKQLEQLKALNETRSHFLANFAHEFQTSLPLVLESLEQMLTGPQEKEREQKKKIRLMLRNSQHLLSLINQLMEFSKCDCGKGTFELEKKMEGIVNASGDKEFLRDMQNIINSNLADPEFNVDQLSRKLHMSHATLYRKIHALTGETPSDFIRSCRLKRGAQLLNKGTSSVLEVALEVGFSSANYFSKCFKKKFHQLPSEYQLPDAS